MGGDDHGPRRRPREDPRLTELAAGARFRSVQYREEKARDRLAEWGQAHGVPWVAFSGGKDSTAAALLVEDVFGARNVQLVLFDSGLEFPETVPYCEDLAAKRGWSFHRVAAEPSALDHLVASGLWDLDAPNVVNPFGVSFHELLILRPAAKAETMFGPVMVWGLRSEESKRRRMLLGKSRGVYTTKGGVTRMAPVWDWGADDVTGFIASRGVGLCPVYGRLRELGVPAEDARLSTMVDVSALGHGRMGWLRLGWPAEWARLCALLPRLREFG